MTKCVKCNLTFNDTMAYNKHQWKEHPANDIEKYWSDLYKSGALFSGKYTMAYMDDPYY